MGLDQQISELQMNIYIEKNLGDFDDIMPELFCVNLTKDFLWQSKWKECKLFLTSDLEIRENLDLNTKLLVENFYEAIKLPQLPKFRGHDIEDYGASLTVKCKILIPQTVYLAKVVKNFLPVA